MLDASKLEYAHRRFSYFLMLSGSRFLTFRLPRHSSFYFLDDRQPWTDSRLLIDARRPLWAAHYFRASHREESRASFHAREHWFRWAHYAAHILSWLSSLLHTPKHIRCIIFGAAPANFTASFSRFTVFLFIGFCWYLLAARVLPLAFAPWSFRLDKRYTW